MNDLDSSAFIDLFKNAFEKCFGYALSAPLTETESKLLYNKIFEKTGLVIGWKSLKNYSAFVFNENTGKQENPSIATLDTLARYVLDAPFTDELQRKNSENHYPWWFNYKDQHIRSKHGNKQGWKMPRRITAVASLGLIAIIFLLIYFTRKPTSKSNQFTDAFSSVQDDSLELKGWFVQSKDSTWWAKRSDRPASLTLYSLQGDNWPDSLHSPRIKNLVLRKINSDCFTVEAHLSGFFPTQNWQQAGILLLEDTGFTGKSMRLSLMYNDYSGGFTQHKQILVQAISSLGVGFGKPEEISHTVLFDIDSANDIPAIRQNINHTALRIEKQGKKFRFLFADGPLENSAFKEAVSHEFDMDPHYIGLFALRGFVNAEVTPATFNFFKLMEYSCKQ